MTNGKNRRAIIMTTRKEILLNSDVSYEYHVKCNNNKTVILNVDHADLIYNADGEFDCPLDVVLKKNYYTFQDLMDWGSESLHFVEMNGHHIKTLKVISLQVNL